MLVAARVDWAAFFKLHLAETQAKHWLIAPSLDFAQARHVRVFVYSARRRRRRRRCSGEERPLGCLCQLDIWMGSGGLAQAWDAFLHRSRFVRWFLQSSFPFPEVARGRRHALDRRRVFVRESS